MPVAFTPHAEILHNTTSNGSAVFPAGFQQAPRESDGKRVREILDSSGLFDKFHPGFSHSHATEAALVKVINGLNATAEKEAWPCLYYQI